MSGRFNSLLYEWANEQQVTRIADGDDNELSSITYRRPAQTCSGEPATSVDGNGNQRTYAYNARCNLTGISQAGPAGDIVLTYDNRDRIRTFTAGDGRRQTVS